MNPLTSTAADAAAAVDGGDGEARRPARRAPAADHRRLLRPHRRPGRGLQVVRAGRAAVRPSRRGVLGQAFFDDAARRPAAADGRGVARVPRAGEPPRARARSSVAGRTRRRRRRSRSRPSSSRSSSTRASTSRSSSRTSSFELPMNLMLLRMRQQHPVVVRALRAGARARAAAVGGLAHRRHARRLPPARSRRRGSRTSWPAARPSAPRRTPRPRSA